MFKGEQTEPLRECVELKGYAPPHMVQIPLEEYRRYIESGIKGRTVEISLCEYDRLRMETERLQRDNMQLQYDNQNMQEEISRRADIKIQIDQATQKIINELKVTDSDTKERR